MIYLCCFHVGLVFDAELGVSLRVEDVWFESGGVRLFGVVYVPDKVPAPALIVCHGFDRRGFHGYALFEQMANEACERGFLCLVFDFRGCGKSGGEFGYGWGEQGDLEAAIEFLLGRPEARADSVYVVGHSLGGAMALYVAEKNVRVRVVVLWATPHDHAYNIRRFILRTRGRLSWFLFLLISYVDVVVPVHRLWSLRVWGFSLRPRDMRRKWMMLRESEVLRRLRSDVSVLIVNGRLDEVVGAEEAQWNFEAARGFKELVVVEGANHAFQGEEEETIELTIKWLVKQVKL